MWLACLLLAYLLGSVPFGVIVSTLAGGDADLRFSGSGNIGATNVARVFGWRLAALAMIGDVGKGLLPTLFALVAWPDAGLWWPALVGTTALVGHCWPVYLEFRGGKGVATAAGALLVLLPVPTLIAAAAWGGLLAGFGVASGAALGATLVLVMVTAVWYPGWIPFVSAIGTLIGLRHLANVRRLAAGQEEPVVTWGRRQHDSARVEDLLNRSVKED